MDQNLTIRVGLDNSQLQAAQRQYNSALNSMNNSTKRFSRDFGISGDYIILKLRSIIGYYSIMAAAQPFKEAIKSAIEFEKQLAIIGTLTNSTTKQINKLSDSIVEYTKNSDRNIFTVTEQAEGLRILAQAGYDATESQNALQSVMKFSTATTANLESATEDLIGVINAYGYSIKDANTVAGEILQTLNVSVAGWKDYRVAIQYAGQVAQTANTSLIETNAVLATFAQLGLRGSKAGTTFRQAITTLIRPTKSLAEILGDENIISLGGLDRTLEVIKARVEDQGMTLEEYAGILRKEFGVRTGGSVAILLQFFDTYKKYYNDLQNADVGSLLDRQTKAIENTIYGRLANLKAVFQAQIVGAFGDPKVQESIREAIKTIVDTIRGIDWEALAVAIANFINIFIKLFNPRAASDAGLLSRNMSDFSISANNASGSMMSLVSISGRFLTFVNDLTKARFVDFLHKIGIGVAKLSFLMGSFRTGFSSGLEQAIDDMTLLLEEGMILKTETVLMKNQTLFAKWGDALGRLFRAITQNRFFETISENLKYFGSGISSFFRGIASDAVSMLRKIAKPLAWLFAIYDFFRAANKFGYDFIGILQAVTFAIARFISGFGDLIALIGEIPIVGKALDLLVRAFTLNNYPSWESFWSAPTRYLESLLEKKSELEQFPLVGSGLGSNKSTNNNTPSDTNEKPDWLKNILSDLEDFDIESEKSVDVMQEMIDKWGGLSEATLLGRRTIKLLREEYKLYLDLLTTDVNEFGITGGSQQIGFDFVKNFREQKRNITEEISSLQERLQLSRGSQQFILSQEETDAITNRIKDLKKELDNLSGNDKNKKTFKEKFDDVKAYVEIVSDNINQVISLSSISTNNQLEGIRQLMALEAERWAERSAQLEAQGLATSAMYKAESRAFEISQKSKRDKERRLQAKAWEQDKAGKLLQTIMNTAEGLAKSFTLLPPFNFINAGIVSAIGAAQTAVISSTKNPYKMARGGTIPGIGNFDNTPVQATPGEFLVNRQSARANASALEFINKGGVVGGGDTYVNITVQGSVTTEGELVKVLIPALKKAVKRGVE